MLLPDGTTKTVPASEVEKIDFGSSGRVAWIADDRKRRVCASVSRWGNGAFRGKALTGDSKDTALPAPVSAVIYPVPEPAKKLKVTHVAQKPDYCGEACVEMVTTFLGKRVSQDRVNKLAGLGGKRGVYASELERVIAQLKLKTAKRRSWPGRSNEDFILDRIRLTQAIERNHPVLLGIWYDCRNKTNADIWAFDHFVLLVGYDLKKRCFLIHDPARAKACSQVSFDEFAKHRRTGSGQVYGIEFTGKKGGR